MQILNLTDVNKSDIKYFISCFPDGEVQITLGEFSRKDDLIKVICRITNPEELFILCQVNNILTRHGVSWCLNILYLMGMRMDRVMDFNRPFTLSVVSGILNSFSYERVAVLEPHSIRTTDLINKCAVFEDYLPKDLIVGTKEFSDKWNLVLPDDGAYKRYCRILIKNSIPYIKCKKSRDVNTEQLLSFEVENPESILNATRPLIIRDDLCDEGDTFCGIANAIRAIRPDVELNILVTHMVNLKGIENLSKNFNHVYFTNSYKDWNTLKAEYGKAVPVLPENVTQIEIV